MNHNIHILKVADNGFSYNHDFDYNQAAAFTKQIEISLHNTLEYPQDGDVVTVTSSVTYSIEDKELFHFYTVMLFEVPGWGAEAKSLGASGIKASPLLPILLDTGVGYLRGNLSAQAKHTPFEGLTLPMLSTEDLIQGLTIRCLPASI